MNRNLLPVVMALLAAIMVLNGCRSTSSVPVTKEVITQSTSERPSTGVYDHASYDLVTIRPEGSETSFSIRPNQHYSIAIFAEWDPYPNLEVYYTCFPKERMADSIYVEYDRPSMGNNDSGVGIVVGHNRSHFSILAPAKGWYTVHFYYDIPKGMLASSLSEVDIYVQWEISKEVK